MCEAAKKCWFYEWHFVEIYKKRRALNCCFLAAFYIWWAWDHDAVERFQFLLEFQLPDGWSHVWLWKHCAGGVNPSPVQRRDFSRDGMSSVQPTPTLEVHKNDQSFGSHRRKVLEQAGNRGQVWKQVEAAELKMSRICLGAEMRRSEQLLLQETVWKHTDDPANQKPLGKWGADAKAIIHSQ